MNVDHVVIDILFGMDWDCYRCRTDRYIKFTSVKEPKLIISADEYGCRLYFKGKLIKEETSSIFNIRYFNPLHGLVKDLIDVYEEVERQKTVANKTKVLREFKRFLGLCG